ncbi:hypothetical protein C8R45DRAFT_1157346 [Mycena sanguinolenta]|nr:hypothetical protein C8R45DRAFT_1157346 [Mycena sanguinolenta]
MAGAKIGRSADVKFGLHYKSFSEFGLRHASLPLLHSISLDIVQWISPDDDSVDDTVTITHAPSLRHAHIFTLPHVKIAIPWAPLTTLTLPRDLPFTECMLLLQGCPNLINLTVSAAGPATARADHVILNFLETLACNFGVASVLEHLTLPHFSQLDVSNVHEPEHVTIFSAFIARSGCPLQSLAVRDIRDISPVTLVLFLRAVPHSVSDAEFAWARVSAQPMFSALQFADMIPQLKVLKLKVNGRMDNEGYKNLLEMLHARVEAPTAPLESVMLHLTTKQRARIMPRNSRIAEFRQLATVGLKINLTITNFFNSSTHVVLDSSVQGAFFGLFFKPAF